MNKCYDFIFTILIMDTTYNVMCETILDTKYNKADFNIRNKRHIKTTTTTEKYKYEPIEFVNQQHIAKSSEEVNLFFDSRIRISLLNYLEYNHSALWNRSIEDAVYDPMKNIYIVGGPPKFNALEGYFVVQRFVDNYERMLDNWINHEVLNIIKEDKNKKRQNLLELLKRQQTDYEKVPYHYVEQFWAWELYHTERYNKREFVLRNNLRVLYIQLEKTLFNYVFTFEKFEHPGIPVISFDEIMNYLRAGEPFMKDTIKKLLLGSIEVLHTTIKPNGTQEH